MTHGGKRNCRIGHTMRIQLCGVYGGRQGCLRHGSVHCTAATGGIRRSQNRKTKNCFYCPDWRARTVGLEPVTTWPEPGHCTNRTYHVNPTPQRPGPAGRLPPPSQCQRTPAAGPAAAEAAPFPGSGAEAAWHLAQPLARHLAAGSPGSPGL